MITTDPATDVALQLVGRPRETAIEALLESVDCRREPLERARDALIHRLAHRPDDFDATKALRLVYEALARVGFAGQPTVSGTPVSGTPDSPRGRRDDHRRKRGLLHRRRSVFGH